MRHEIGIEQPEYLVEDWPGKYDVFSWLEYVVTVPNAIFIVTTLKANRRPNANLHSWGMLIGDRGNYTSLLALLRHTHTCESILREGEWCLNYPSLDQLGECGRTIHCTSQECDEIRESGFTAEPAATVAAPRIAEALVCLECRLQWERPLCEGSRWHLFSGRVQHLAMDDAAMAATPEERLANLKLMYNVRSTVHLLTGEQYGPNTFAMLAPVLRTSSESGSRS